MAVASHMSNMTAPTQTGVGDLNNILPVRIISAASSGSHVVGAPSVASIANVQKPKASPISG